MSMKLVFPGSDRAQMLLEQRNYRIGSDPSSDLVVDGSVVAMHCELAVSAQGVQLRIAEGSHAVVNERSVTGLIALRPGDTLSCGATRIRLVKTTAPADPSLSSSIPDTDTQVQATMVRPVLPKFVLRGLSGEQFGRSHPLLASMLVGRVEDASLCLSMEGISRQHARLTPAGDEVLVEDLGSSNGTWINGKRISRGQARHGDEIRFDNERFQLVVPGQVVVSPKAASVVAGRRGVLLAALFAAAACVVVLVLLQG